MISSAEITQEKRIFGEEIKEEKREKRTREGAWKNRRGSMDGQERVTGRAGEGALKDRRG